MASVLKNDHRRSEQNHQRQGRDKGPLFDWDWRLAIGERKRQKIRNDAPDDDDDDDGDGDDAEWKCEPAASPRERISTLKRKTRRVVVQHEQ